MESSAIGLIAALTLWFTVCCIVWSLRIATALKVIVCAGLILRFAGATVRYLILMVGYNGIGDAMSYYREGQRWAERFWVGDFTPLYDPVWWRGARFWGTQFVSFPASIVTGIIGPNLLGSFIVFSMLAFVGLIGFISAYRHARPRSSVTVYAAMVLFFPSLWFWPSSLGKEAIAMLGLGLTVAGLFGRGQRIRLIPLLIGFFVLASVRSELAGIVAVSVLISQWLSFETRWTVAGVTRAVVVAVVTILVVRVASQRVGITSFDVEGITTFIEHDPARDLGGGSGIEAVSVGLGGMVAAPVNVLFRPFPWEARSGLILLSSIELVGFWAMVWIRRRQFVASLRSWREDPLTRLSIVFVLVYAVGLGMMLSNLGIIARQRVFLFPFLLVLLQDRRAARPVVRVPIRMTHPSGSRNAPQPVS